MSNIKLLTVVGARPQFVKAAVISRVLREQYPLVEEIMVHTGQHFDKNMSDVFFEELGMSEPKYSLNINSVSHGEMIGRMIIELSDILANEKPDCVIVYGDTNSTLAGGIAAKKLNIPVAHIEAGVRNYDEEMPEESNRYLVDRLADINFCCTDLGYSNLMEEGYNLSKLKRTVSLVGDLMFDSAKHESSKNLSLSKTCLDILESQEEFVLVTIHRASNTDNREILSTIVHNLNRIHSEKRVVMLIHPRTKVKLKEFGIQVNFQLVDPLGYFDTLSLVRGSSMVVTDSGGLIREAYFFEKKGLFVLADPVWPELVDARVSINVVPEGDLLYSEYKQFSKQVVQWTEGIFGVGDSGQKIIREILEHLDNSSDKTM